MDLGNYAMKSFVQDQLDNYTKKEALNEALSSYLKREDIAPQLETYIKSQGSTGSLDQKIASFLYIKQADVQKYLERQDFDKEMLNYIKKVDLNTELQKYVVDANLETRVAALGFTKSSDLKVAETSINSLATVITNSSTARKNLVDAIAADTTGIPGAVADKFITNEAALTNVATKIGNTHREQLAASIAQNSITLPDNIAEQITGNEARASILAGKIMSQQQNQLVTQIKEKLITDNSDQLRGPPGDLGNAAAVESSIKPKTMWCATGEYCEVPTAKKGLILGKDQVIIGDGTDKNRFVRVRDYLAFQSNTGIDFANDIEAQAHDILAAQIKPQTRSVRNNIKDGTILSRFDTVNDTEATAKNSALEIHGIGKSYGALRHPRQIKMYDNVFVGGKFDVNGDGTTGATFMTGNVGIGITNPSSKLEVNDTGNGKGIHISAFNATGAGSQPVLTFNRKGPATPTVASIGSGWGGSGDLFFNTGTNNVATTNMILDGTGKLGLGTNTPSDKLHVAGTIRGDSFRLGEGLLTITNEGSHRNIQTWDAKPLTLNTEGNNVGVGVTSPYYKLDVNGTIRSNTAFAVVNNAAPWDHGRIFHDGGALFIDAGGAENGIVFRTNTSGTTYPATSYNERMRILDNGDVVIKGNLIVEGDITTTNRLRAKGVEANALMTNTLVANEVQLGDFAITPKDDWLLFHTSPGGNPYDTWKVGMNKTDPVQRLKSSGGILAEGNIEAKGILRTEKGVFFKASDGNFWTFNGDNNNDGIFANKYDRGGTWKGQSGKFGNSF